MKSFKILQKETDLIIKSWETGNKNSSKSLADIYSTLALVESEILALKEVICKIAEKMQLEISDEGGETISARDYWNLLQKHIFAVNMESLLNEEKSLIE